MSTTASSLVSSDVVSQLNQVLSSLVSNNNDLRSSAERQLNEQWITQQPELLLLSLAQLGRAHEEAHVRNRFESYSVLEMKGLEIFILFTRFL
jgi:hypothetical protein